MPVVIYFLESEDHVRAVGILSEADETYHGVDKGSILVSQAGLEALQAAGVRFRVIGEKPKKEKE